MLKAFKKAGLSLKILLKIQFIIHLPDSFQTLSGNLWSSEQVQDNLHHFCFVCTGNSVYAYSLKELYSAATGMENSLPSLEQDPLWERNIDPTTHRFYLPRHGVTSWLPVVWRALMFLTGRIALPLFFPGYAIWPKSTSRPWEESWH